MIWNESNYLILLFLVLISTLAGRISLRRSSGYESSFDSARLVSLIQNAVLFFLSALFCLFLLCSSSHTLRRDLPALCAVFLLYIAEILVFFCFRRLGAFFRRWGKRIGGLFQRLFRKNADRAAAPADQALLIPMPQEGATPRGLLLRFLSVFNLAFAVCVIAFLALMLLVESVDNALTLTALFRRAQEQGQGLFTAYHYELLLPFFFLSLTAATGALLAATDLDYRCRYTRQRAQGNLEALSRRVRSR